MKFIQEFKEFAIKGNVIDLAVGVIIGTAFGKIVSSLVADVIMPPLGFITGGIDFKDKTIVLKEASEGVQAVTLNYGLFLQNILDFIIIALVIFLVIKQVNRFKRGQDAAPTTKECNYCFESIPIKATRCPRCTSTLSTP